MAFEQASQNGIIPADELYTRISPHSLIINTTSTYYGQPAYIRLVNTAPYPKDIPATFFAEVTNGGTTSTITLGQAYFEGPTATLQTFTLGTGTNKISATWPGESRYEGFTAELETIVAVAPGQTLNQTNAIYSYPPSGTIVTGETTATFTLLIDCLDKLPGYVLWYENDVQIGSSQLINNQSVISTNGLSAGVRTIRAQWPGGFIGNVFYQGFSKEIVYTVLRGAESHASLTFTISPPRGIYLEGSTTFLATLNTSTSLAGNVKIVNSATGVTVGTSPVVNNQATIIAPNNMAIGTYTYCAIWDGNQSGHPRYTELVSTNTDWTIVAREVVTDIAFTIDPPTTYYTEPILFRADLTSIVSPPGVVDFYDNGYIIATAPIINKVAQVTVSTLTTGTHDLYAYYAGSAVIPKFYGKKSNVITTTTLAGEPLSFSLELKSSYGETKLYYNEPLKLVLTSNTSTPVVSGTTATFTIDNPVITGSRFICSTTGTTSTVSATSSLAGIVAGTGFYSDPTYSNLLGRVITTGTNVHLDTAVTLSNTPVWIKDPQYAELGPSTFIGNTATAIAIVNTTTQVIGYSDWIGSQISNGHYYMEEIQYSNTATLGKRYLSEPITLSEIGNPDYQGEPLDIVLLTTSTIDLSGTTATIYANGAYLTDATFVGDIATASAIVSGNSGTYVLSAEWHGGSTPSQRFYQPKASTTATENITWHTLTNPVSISSSATIFTAYTPNVNLTAYVDTTGSNTTASINGPVQMTIKDTAPIYGITPQVYSFDILEVGFVNYTFWPNPFTPGSGNIPYGTSNPPGLPNTYSSGRAKWIKVSADVIPQNQTNAIIALSINGQLKVDQSPEPPNVSALQNYYGTSHHHIVGSYIYQGYGYILTEFESLEGQYIVGYADYGPYPPSPDINPHTPNVIYYAFDAIYAYLWIMMGGNYATLSSRTSFVGTGSNIIGYTTSTITTTATFVNNVGTLSIPISSYQGQHTLSGTWIGSRFVPYFFPKEINPTILNVISPQPVTSSLTLSTTTFYKFNLNGTTNSIQTATIKLVGSSSVNPPSGNVTLYDVTSSTYITLGSTSLTSTGTTSTAIIAWTPLSTAENSNGVKNLRAVYTTDGYNSSTIINSSFVVNIDTRTNPTVFSVIGTQTNYILGNTITLQANLNGARPTNPINFIVDGTTVTSKLYAGTDIVSYSITNLTTGTHILGINIPADTNVLAYNSSTSVNLVSPQMRVLTTPTFTWDGSFLNYSWSFANPLGVPTNTYATNGTATVVGHFSNGQDYTIFPGPGTAHKNPCALTTATAYYDGYWQGMGITMNSYTYTFVFNGTTWSSTVKNY